MAVTIILSVPESTKLFLDEQARQEGFDDLNEYVRAVFSELEQRKLREELENKLREGLQSPTFRMTEQHWQDLENEVRDRSPELNSP